MNISNFCHGTNHYHLARLYDNMNFYYYNNHTLLYNSMSSPRGRYSSIEEAWVLNNKIYHTAIHASVASQQQKTIPFQ